MSLRNFLYTAVFIMSSYISAIFLFSYYTGNTYVFNDIGLTEFFVASFMSFTVFAFSYLLFDKRDFKDIFKSSSQDMLLDFSPKPLSKESSSIKSFDKKIFLGFGFTNYILTIFITIVLSYLFIFVYIASYTNIFSFSILNKEWFNNVATNIMIILFIGTVIYTLFLIIFNFFKDIKYLNIRLYLKNFFIFELFLSFCFVIGISALIPKYISQNLVSKKPNVETFNLINGKKTSSGKFLGFKDKMYYLILDKDKQVIMVNRSTNSLKMNRKISDLPVVNF